jgi:mannitol/fructose-specific phosphotransferase system IIA component (Ntr-type)
MAITPAELLNPKHVELAVRSRTAEPAIRELINVVAADEPIADLEKFADQVIARERTSPSAVEEGVVFPHARTDLVEEILLVIGRSRAGVRFGKSDQRANLIFLIGVPQRLVSDYLICVGALARIVRNETIRSDLLRAPAREEFTAILRTALSPEGAV